MRGRVRVRARRSYVEGGTLAACPKFACARVLRSSDPAPTHAHDLALSTSTVDASSGRAHRLRSADLGRGGQLRPYGRVGFLNPLGKVFAG